MHTDDPRLAPARGIPSGPILAALLAALTFDAGQSASAQQAKCVAGKTRCLAKNATGRLKCEQLAETPGKIADPNAGGCLDKVAAKFDGGVDPTKGCFERLEGKSPNDCITFDDAATAGSLVEACVATLVSAIDPPPLDQTKCGAGKKKCAAKYAAGLLKCQQLAHTPGRSSDPNDKGCIDKAQAKYDGGVDPTKGCVAKLEAASGNDCQATGDSATLQGLVETCVTDLVALVTTPVSTTTTTLVSGSVSFSADVQPIFTAHCAFAGCHAGANPAEGLDLAAGHAYANLVDVASGECPLFKRVLPASPGQSYLVFKLAGGSQPCFSGSQMPIGAPPLTAAQQSAISDWITEGAPNN